MGLRVLEIKAGMRSKHQVPAARRQKGRECLKELRKEVSRYLGQEEGSLGCLKAVLSITS